MPSSFGSEPLPEPKSIVPESWFAQPRKPQEPDAEATQMWTPQAQPGDQSWGAPMHAAGGGPQGEATMLDGTVLDGATQMAPGPAMGSGMPADQGTRLDFNAGPGQNGLMGAPPMGAGGPMGAGMPPMGPGGPMGGQAGPGDPAFPGYQHQPPARSGGGTSKPLLIAVSALVAVAVAAVAFVVWPSGDGSDPGAKPAKPRPGNTKVAQTNQIPSASRQQAGAMNAVLNASVDTRRVLAGALGRARTCKDLPTAIQGFQTVAQRRQNQLRRTQSLKLDKLSNGERLRGSLRQALQASLEVDQALLLWAQRNQRKCKGKPRPDAAHAPGRAVSEQRATLAKRQFVVLWNPVAKRTGQPQRSWQRV
ncbi:hypothetical protein E1298_43400 [Actinomadura rubrisoli]|uniref:Uncharacterized protein n=1 Tax=Actinomadura rubrisoli TaxID=2530368 RepID=A0A4R4ZWM9_9ACTN|nr:hypothetical protein E1298_43400 [Actinomadura rubrisoli]